MSSCLTQVYIASGYFDMPGERRELHEKILPAISKKCVPLRIKVGRPAKNSRYTERARDGGGEKQRRTGGRRRATGERWRDKEKLEELEGTSLCRNANHRD